MLQEINMKKKLIIPNLFIVGAPKCGTTAISKYLSEHPDIFFSRPKELHYFSDDINYHNNHYHDISDYLKVFQDATSEKVIAEGSVYYLFSATAIKNILAFNPEAKFIAMVRNPLTMAPSLHKQLYYNGDEYEKDFNKAWRREYPDQERAACTDTQLIDYKNVCKTGRQLQRAFKQIPEKQLHIIVFDDFVNNTDHEFANALSFLGVKQITKKEFPRVNPATSVKSSLLHKALTFLAKKPNVLKKTLKKIFGYNSTLLRNIYKRLKAINTKPVKQYKIMKNTYTSMLHEFRHDIQLTEQLLDRDLSHWRRIPK